MRNFAQLAGAASIPNDLRAVFQGTSRVTGADPL